MVPSLMTIVSTGWRIGDGSEDEVKSKWYQTYGCTTAVNNRARSDSITPTNFASIQSTLDRNHFLPFSHEVITVLELIT